jgi:SAM-dependent methyltransferase
VSENNISVGENLKNILEQIPDGFPKDLFVGRIHCCICGAECVPPGEVSGFYFLLEMNGVLDFLNNKFSLYCCNKCGLGVVSPQVAVQHIGLLYKKPESREFMDDGVFVNRIRQFFFRREARFWLKWFKAEKVGRNREWYLLDFGTGSGLNALAFANVLNGGWKMWACDFSVDPPPLLLANKQVSYFSQKILEKSKQKFDCIHLRHILEHTPDPLVFLLQMKELLSEKGALFIEIPSLYPALHPFTRRYFPELFQSSFPYHYCFFSKESLNALMSRAGFSCEIRMVDIPVLGRLLQSRTGRLFLGRKYILLFLLGVILYPLQWLYVQLTGVQPMIRVLARKKDE